jgi:hypothetical protein
MRKKTLQKRGCNKEKKDQPTTKNKKGIVSNTQNQKEQNV